MAKIREVRISFERLLKVWLSKLDADEEELVEEDIIWLNSVFDDFFKGTNIVEYIDVDGRYQERKPLDFDFSEILERSMEFSGSKQERLNALKYKEPSLFEYYKSLNDLYISREGKYNLMDIYFRMFKKLYIQAELKDLTRVKKSIIYSVNLTVLKILIFEKDGFNSNAFLNDFYYVVLENIFTEKELKEEKPDSYFISTVLFRSNFYVYYNTLFSFKKVKEFRQYLLKTWIFLNDLGKNGTIDDYLDILSDMTLSNSQYRELDLYDIRSMLKIEDRDSEFYKYLNQIKSKVTFIVTSVDISKFLEFLFKSEGVKTPDYISADIVQYFQKSEEDAAIALFKFREMQSMVLEFLGIVMHFKGKEYLFMAVLRLRKNEQWSNHRTFFPKSINDVLVWLILFSELKREMNFIIGPSFGYKFLDEIIVFLFKDIAFDEKSMKNSMGLRELLLDSSFLNSMTVISSDLLNKIDGNDLLTDEEKENSSTFWRSMVNFFGGQIQRSESLTPIESSIFDDLISSISNQYIDKSLVYFLSNNLSQFDRNEKSQKELRTFVIASDLQLRKYIIPDWYSPSYGLSESIGRYLLEEENMQMDYNFFSKQIPLQNRELKREDVQEIINKYSKGSLLVFRNAFPDFWIKGEKSKTDKTDLTSPVTFRYNTFDRDSELIIVPKSSMSILYIYDGRFKNLQFLKNTLMWELLDLGGGHEENLLKVKSINGFTDRFNLADDELRKHFWIRIAAKAKIVIKDENSILRFKLNPYVE